jgi:hypothetical protein
MHRLVRAPAAARDATGLAQTSTKEMLAEALDTSSSHPNSTPPATSA